MAQCPPPPKYAPGYSESLTLLVIQYFISQFVPMYVSQGSATCGPFSNFSWAASYSVLQSLCGPRASRK